jgi:hypothetical protein
MSDNCAKTNPALAWVRTTACAITPRRAVFTQLSGI